MYKWTLEVKETDYYYTYKKINKVVRLWSDVPLTEEFLKYKRIREFNRKQWNDDYRHRISGNWF